MAGEISDRGNVVVGKGSVREFSGWEFVRWEVFFGKVSVRELYNREFVRIPDKIAYFGRSDYRICFFY